MSMQNAMPVERLRPTKARLPRKPTPRQLEILQLRSLGYTATDIAQELGISRDTIRTHDGSTLLRLRARNLAHAVSIGMRQGWITGLGVAAAPDERLRERAEAKMLATIDRTLDRLRDAENQLIELRSRIAEGVE